MASHSGSRPTGASDMVRGVLDERTDQELLQAWGDGDLNAGHALFERHFESLHRFFRTKADGAVEDLMQQTLLACLEGRDRFRREASFRTFMFQIARFQLYAFYRARNRDRVFDFVHVSATDLGDTPSRALARRQDADLLLQALRRIPLEAQLILELRFWEELTGPEIAEVLTVGEPTVRSRLRRALEQLRVEMQRLDADCTLTAQSDDDLERWAGRLREAVEIETCKPPKGGLGGSESQG